MHRASGVQIAAPAPSSDAASEPVLVDAPTPSPEPPALAPVVARINSLPGSSVFVDGVAMGLTPLSDTLLPGTHTLLLKADDGREATTTISVPTDGVFSFCWQFDTNARCLQ